MNTLQAVPAVQYEIKVYEGTMDLVHGGGDNIKEIFIPSHKIIVNSHGGLFHSEKPRNVQSLEVGNEDTIIKNPLRNIQLPGELVEKIALVARMKLEISSKEKEVVSDLKQILI